MLNASEMILISLIPVLPHVIVTLDYSRRLGAKRIRVLKLLQNTETLEYYHAAFGGAGGSAEEVVGSIFDTIYNWGSFGWALVLNAVVMSWIFGAVVFGASGVSPYIDAFISHGRVSMAAAFAGSYVWVTAALVQQYSDDDLSPASLHAMWVRVLAATTVASALSPQLLKDNGAVASTAVISFLIAVFPVDTLQSLVRNLARKYMPGLISEAPAQAPSLYKLQGMTERVINRLADENIESAERLAYSDPLKLMVRTNIPWVTIVDLIDAALLYGYLGDGVQKTPTMGIRGSIEAARLGADLFKAGVDPAILQRAEATLTEFATVLSIGLESARYLILTLWEDQQVQFIWSLFTVVVPDEQRDVGQVEQGNQPEVTSSAPTPSRAQQ